MSKMGKVVSSPCELSWAEPWLTQRFGPGDDCGPVHTPSELTQLACGWCPKCLKHNSWIWCNSNHDKTDLFAQWDCCSEQISWPWMELGSCLGYCHWGLPKVLDFLDTQIRCLWECFSTSTACQANSPPKAISAFAPPLVFPPNKTPLSWFWWVMVTYI